jgi:glycerol-3-phosphate acyltransferase PlsY
MKILIIIFSYFLGSVPFGLLIGYIKGVDVRKYGSGNIGATNVYRNLGALPGITTFLADTAKGAFSVYLAKILTGDLLIQILSGTAAIFGHMFPIYLRFKGGKGIATGLGVILGLAYLCAIFCFFIWIIVVILTGYVSLASIVASIFLPLFLFLTKSPNSLVIFGIVVSVFVVYKHKENIKRLINKKEPKIWRKK